MRKPDDNFSRDLPIMLFVPERFRKALNAEMFWLIRVMDTHLHVCC